MALVMTLCCWGRNWDTLFHIASGEWLVQGRLFIFILSIILRMGIGLYGFGEEFDAVREE